MKSRRWLKRIGFSFLLLFFLALVYGVFYCWRSFPIISGYGAKNLCSAVFVAHQREEQAKGQDLGFFPMTLGTFTVDYKDSSVTGSVWGLAKKKAIYRNGLGVTLVNGLSEADIRRQAFVLAAAPVVDADSIAWPMGDRVADSIPEGLDTAVLRAAVERGFVDKDSLRPVYTRSVVVIYKGQLVAEHYAPGFSSSNRFQGWSMSKSLTSALTGLLVKWGKLDVEAPAPVPEWSDVQDPRHAIRLKDILQQNTGLDFLEDYSKYCDATRMLFQEADMGGFTARHLLKKKPGTEFYYSSGNSNILARIIRKTVGEAGYHAFPYDSLFYKLGMYSMVLEPDASGTFVGSSYSYATARDWARFGLLYLNRGKWMGEQVLPEAWVKESTTPVEDAQKGQYGYMFWLNAGPRGDVTGREYPSVPADMFCADGFQGQRVYVVPSKQLVVVRLGLTQHSNFDQNQFLSDVLKAVR